MNPVDPTTVADRLAVGGTAGLIAGLVFALIAVVIGYQTQWIVPGWLYKKAEADGKSWQTLAESLGEKVDRLTTLGEGQQATLVKVSERGDRTEALATENGRKLDRLTILAESRRRPTG